MDNAILDILLINPNSELEKLFFTIFLYPDKLKLPECNISILGSDLLSFEATVASIRADVFLVNTSNIFSRVLLVLSNPAAMVPISFSIDDNTFEVVVIWDSTNCWLLSTTVFDIWFPIFVVSLSWDGSDDNDESSSPISKLKRESSNSVSENSSLFFKNQLFIFFKVIWLLSCLYLGIMLEVVFLNILPASDTVDFASDNVLVVVGIASEIYDPAALEIIPAVLFIYLPAMDFFVILTEASIYHITTFI